MSPTRIESVRIKGFRSLADVELLELPSAAVLIGANGSGKSNFIHFFEMLSWMLRSRKLGEFVAMQGGADDQLFGGNARTPRIEAEIGMRPTRAGTTIDSYSPMRILTASSLRTRVFVSAIVLTAFWRSGSRSKVDISKPR